MKAPDPKNVHPPKVASRFLHFFCSDRLVEEIEGDLEEYYLIYRRRFPHLIALIYYWFHLLSFIRPYAIKKNYSLTKSYIMFGSNIKFSFRQFSKNLTHSFLNIIGLSVGIACFLFTFIYLDGELSFDSYHTGAKDIHRVVIDFVNEGERIPDATTPPALAPALKADVPEVQYATRVFPTWGGRYLMGVNRDRQFYEEQVFRVDADFLNIFTYKILSGEKEFLLDDPSDIVLTESSAKKYFGEENPLGKELTLFSQDNKKMIVSGVIQDVPFNSHFTFDFLIPIHFEGRNIDQQWGWYNFYTYVKLHDGSISQEFEEKLQPLYLISNPRDSISTNITYSQPLQDIHLHSALKWELGTNGNMSNIKIFIAIGTFIFLISLINFLNLTISSLVRRSKEVGVRKSFGAKKAHLIGQFVTEALVIIILSLIIGGLLTELAFKGFQDLFEREISLLDPSNFQSFGLLSLLILGFGLLAGIYPSIYFSRLGTVVNLTKKQKSKFLDLKQVFLVFQFTVSTIMIVGTLVVYQQMNYFRNSDMGFNMDQILVLENTNAISNQQTLKEKVSQLSFVEAAGFSNGIVGKLNWTFTLGYPQSFLMNYAVVSPDYLEAMEFEFLQGRNFDETIETDRSGINIVVNESAMKALKIAEDQIGETIVIGQQQDSLLYGRVLGVVKDFHYSNFKSEIKPYAFLYRDQTSQNLAIRIKAGNASRQLGQLESVWNELAIGVPFQSYFLDQSFESLHKTETRLSQVMLYLTVISIFIALMGMVATVNISIKERLKEIAVRKVLGATVSQVVHMVSGSFLLLVFIANIIGLPIAYLTMQEWLADFSFRVELSPFLFFLTLLLTVTIAYVLVGSSALKAATSRLTERLREE